MEVIKQDENEKDLRPPSGTEMSLPSSSSLSSPSSSSFCCDECGSISMPLIQAGEICCQNCGVLKEEECVAAADDPSLEASKVSLEAAFPANAAGSGWTSNISSNNGHQLSTFQQEVLALVEQHLSILFPSSSSSMQKLARRIAEVGCLRAKSGEINPAEMASAAVCYVASKYHNNDNNGGLSRGSMISIKEMIKKLGLSKKAGYQVSAKVMRLEHTLSEALYSPSRLLQVEERTKNTVMSSASTGAGEQQEVNKADGAVAIPSMMKATVASSRYAASCLHPTSFSPDTHATTLPLVDDAMNTMSSVKEVELSL